MVMLRVSSELGDGVMVRLLTERSMEVCDRFSDVMEDVVTCRLRDECEVKCELIEAFKEG